ncbi:MAG: helix-turn-helix transcriptional regulator [bacterium]|nr:helix-turn-helix transcriptional regulator [bacterium]
MNVEAQDQLMSIGVNIKKFRKMRNISQIELGKLIDTHINNIGRYERDEQMPSAEIIKKLAVVFEVSADALLFDNQADFPAAKFKDVRVVEYVEKIDGLSVRDREVVFTVVDALVVKDEVGRISKKAGQGKS